MNTGRLRRWVLSTCAAVGCLATPAESHAVCGCLRDCWERLFGTSQYPATAALPAPYQPVAGVAAAGAVCPPRYVAQTQYRTEYVTVPVTTMRPYTVCDPCTGCPVTCMRPAVSYVQQPRLVPYTTYRPVQPVCPPPTCGRPACAAPVATAYYAPPASSCCGAAPRSPYYNPAPAPRGMIAPPGQSAPLPGIPRSNPNPLPSTGQPQLPSAGSGATLSRPLSEPARTFAEPSQLAAPRNLYEPPKGFAEQSKPLESLKPIPDANAPRVGTPATDEPRLIDPRNRTTSAPRTTTLVYRPAAATTPAKDAAVEDGWRPSQR